MIIDTNFDHLPYLNTPCLLTIGVFDGMHLGHQKIFQKMHELNPHAHQVAVTFSKQPFEVLFPQKALPALFSLEQRKALLRSTHLNRLVLLDFSEAISQMSYDAFLDKLYAHFHFSDLVLGEDATFGKNRHGIPKNVIPYAAKKGFNIHYIPLEKKQGETITSTAIKKALVQADIQKAIQFLGRPLEYHLSIDDIDDKNILVNRQQLAHLPEGEYAIFHNQEKRLMKILPHQIILVGLKHAISQIDAPVIIDIKEKN